MRGKRRANKSQIHKHILIQAEWFRKALCGEFKEAEEQVIDLPEEDPAIFHFLVAFLYEGRFEPIRPAASALGEQDRFAVLWLVWIS